MRKTKQVLRVLFIISSFLLVSIHAPAYIVDNGSGNGYEGGGGKAESSSLNSIELFVEISGGYYLSAQATVYTILNRIETQNIKGIDYEELHNLATRAINLIRSAKNSYQQVFYIAGNTPYKEYILSSLKNFDYSRFRMRHHLNPVIFSEVECYLKYGDIDGIFNHNFEMCEILENLLLTVEEFFLEKQLPDIKIFWKLNELFSETAIFGSYVARIFHEI